MENYEQMEFDVRLESDRNLQENVNLSIDCKRDRERLRTDMRHTESLQSSMQRFRKA